MKRVTLIVLLALPSALSAQECRGLDPASGYPIVATSPASSATSDWLTDVARAAAYRWKIPSRRRASYTGWERVKRRVLPPEARWADDWSPSPAHRAEALLVLRRDGKRPRFEVVSASGDRTFDRSLPSIATDPMPASAELDRSSLRVDPPVGHRGPFPQTTVKYDITEAGTVDPASIEFVRSPGRSFEMAILDGLLRARFKAPTSNCRPISQSVVQTFGN